MKRNEMVEIIYNLNEVGSKEAADFILKSIEEAGMLPPNFTEEIGEKIFYDHPKTNKHYIETQYRIVKHKLIEVSLRTCLLP